MPSRLPGSRGYARLARTIASRVATDSVGAGLPTWAGRARFAGNAATGFAFPDGITSAGSLRASIGTIGVIAEPRVFGVDDPDARTIGAAAFAWIAAALIATHSVGAEGRRALWAGVADLA